MFPNESNGFTGLQVLYALYNREHRFPVIRQNIRQPHLQNLQTVSADFFGKDVEGDRPVRCSGNTKRLSGRFMDPLLQVKCGRNIGCLFCLSVTLAANQGNSPPIQMVSDKLIKSIPVFIRNQHVHHRNCINKVEAFFQLILQTVQAGEILRKIRVILFAEFHRSGRKKKKPKRYLTKILKMKIMMQPLKLQFQTPVHLT